MFYKISEERLKQAVLPGTCNKVNRPKSLTFAIADLNKFKQLITFSLGSDAESIVYKICAILFMILLLFLTASIYFWYSFSARSLQFNGQQQQSDFARFIQDNKIPKGFTDNFNAFFA